jgi:ribosomal protein S18 acetylase RimI-like enzyme
MKNNITYKKLSKGFSPTKLKAFYNKTVPGKTLGQCRNIIKRSTIMGAFDKNMLVGIGRVLDDTVYAFITDIIVHPDYRKRGIGSGIIKNLCNDFVKRNIKIVHCSTSKDLIKFYKSAGFKYDPDDITLFLKNY